MSFRLTQRVLWRGLPATVMGRTYCADPRYEVRLDDGRYLDDVAEVQLEPVDNVVPMERVAR